MNVRTCCCFLCLPHGCWNTNDWKVVQDIFHKTVFSPQNHSIKCHLCRGVTCGKVNAVLLCNFTHFYLEITFPPSSKETVRGGNRFYTDTNLHLITKYPLFLFLFLRRSNKFFMKGKIHKKKFKGVMLCFSSSDVTCEPLWVSLSMLHSQRPEARGECVFACWLLVKRFQCFVLKSLTSSTVEVHDWPSFSYATSHTPSQVSCQCSALHRKTSRAVQSDQSGTGETGALTSFFSLKFRGIVAERDIQTLLFIII